MSENGRLDRCDGADDLAADQALRHGLGSIPTPEASRDFDARVLAALSEPVAWWRAAWISLRPVFSAAVCSLTVTMIVAHWASQTPAGPAPSPISRRAIAIDDRALDRPDLSVASLEIQAGRQKWDN